MYFLKLNKRAIISPSIKRSVLLCFTLMMCISSSSYAQPVDLNSGLSDSLLQLSTSPISVRYAAYKNEHGVAPSVELQQQWKAEIDAEQESVLEDLPAGVTVVSRLFRVTNAIKVLSDSGLVESLKEMQQVSKVSPVSTHSLNLTYSLPWTGATTAHDYGVKGANMRIGVIDSGVDYFLLALGGDGVYVPNDPTILEPGLFPNSVVTGGIDLVGEVYNPNSPDPAQRIPQPDPDPINLQNGHGTHVSTISAGRAFDEFPSGIAPEAEIYAIKASSANSGLQTGVLLEALEYAVDPNQDGDISDHLDVINLSLGSAFGATDQPLTQALNNVVDLGVIAAAAAGNAGNLTYVVASPSVAPNAISVAAARAGDMPFIPTSISAEGGQLASIDMLFALTGHEISDNISAEVVAINPAANCVFNADVSGKVVISPQVVPRCANIRLSTILFRLGAVALVLENAPDHGFRGNITDPAASVPILITDQSLSTLLPETGAQIDIQFDQWYLDRIPDPIADFSSAGPFPGIFKPDITAPGVSVVTAKVRRGNIVGTFGGTSAATPHIAGAMALLKSQRLDWSPGQLKALLMNYGDPIYNGDGSMVPLSRQGMGDVNIANALNGDVIAMPAGISYGFSSLDQFRRIEKQVTLTNFSDQSLLYNLNLQRGQNLPGIHFDIPGAVWLPANASRTITIAMHLNPYEMFGIEQAQHYEVDGFIEFTGNGKETFHVGYQAVVEPVTTIKLLPSGDDVSIVYNDSQVRAPVSSFVKLPGFQIQGPSQPPVYGGQLVTQGGETRLRLGVALAEAWTSPVPMLVIFDIDIDGAYPYDYRLETRFDPNLNAIMARLTDLETQTVLSEAPVDPDFDSRVMQIDLPIDFLPDLSNAFAIGIIVDRFGLQSVDFIEFNRLIVANDLPFMQQLAPYTSLEASVPSGEALFWLVPHAKLENELLMK